MTTAPIEVIFEVYKDHPEFLRIDLRDVNQKGALDSSLLHVAARTGRLDHVLELARAHAEIDAIGDLGNTPLHEAALCGKSEAAALLLDLGADASIRNEFGQTALEVARLGGKLDVCEVLESDQRGRR